jgi:LmbE family N-acetylglucosaminyl deacetylase
MARDAEAQFPADRFLASLACPGRDRITIPTALVVAHPDDETIGCGAQLPRFSDLMVIHTTDGAPRRSTPAEFGSRQAYADTRARELATALGMAGVSPAQSKGLGWPDQEASLHLVEMAEALAGELAGRDVVITHAYEGGHPDHDATAFAVHAACALIERRFGARPALIEVPLYRAEGSGWVTQTFAGDAAMPETELALSPGELALKRRMMDAHHSQREMLSAFQSETELFREAPAYDFRRLPNAGRLHYESYDWGMTGDTWLELAGKALRDLGLDARP